MTSGAFSKETKRKIAARDDDRCARCGGWGDWRGFQFHHRLPRRMGGTSNPKVELPSNGVMLCADCHDWIESHRTLATLQGWILRDGHDPSKRPITHAQWGTVVLNIDGSITMHDRKEEDDASF